MEFPLALFHDHCASLRHCHGWPFQRGNTRPYCNWYCFSSSPKNHLFFQLCYENFEDQVDFLKNNAIAKLILPVYFSQGIIFWLATSILWCLVLKKTACAKEESDNDSTANFTETLNKRFDQAENIEEHESGGSHDSVVARRSPHVLPRHRDASTGNWHLHFSIFFQKLGVKLQKHLIF